MQYTEEQLFNKCIKYIDSCFSRAEEFDSHQEYLLTELEILGAVNIICSLLENEDYVKKVTRHKDRIIGKLTLMELRSKNDF